jgi:hypothetical protein
MDPIITFASSTLSSIMNYTSGLFSDMEIIVALCIGLPLAFWVIKKAIGLVRVR